MGLEDYPKDRADHKRNGLGGPFAQRFTRLLIKQAAAQSISCEAYALLTIVAATEDAKRYRGPVAFYNEQLMMLLGFGSKDRLRKARQRAIAAGWLRYEEGAKSRAGLYFVCVPSELAGIPDNPVDESEAGLNVDLFPDGIHAGTAPEPLLEPRQNRAGTQSPYSTSTKTKTKTKTGERSAQVQEVVDAWNQTLGKKCELTPERRKAINARLANEAWSLTWREALARIPESPFCMGDNERGWSANLDWFLRKGTVTKILEGTYDPPKPRPKPASGIKQDIPSEQQTLDALANRGTRQGPAPRNPLVREAVGN